MIQINSSRRVESRFLAVARKGIGGFAVSETARPSQFAAIMMMRNLRMDEKMIAFSNPRHPRLSTDSIKLYSRFQFGLSPL